MTQSGRLDVPPVEVEISRDDSLRSAVTKMRLALSGDAIADSGLDARRLLAFATGLEPKALIAEPDRQLGDAAPLVCAALAKRRARMPVSRIIGHRDFYGRRFTITPDVLDPRPETETVIDAALAAARRHGWDKRPAVIADIGTGSGALILTLLAELPLARGIATDISTAALEVAARNASAHGVSVRCRFIETSILDGICEPIDLIVSNPPYIRAADIILLDAEVREHDPLIALDGGDDGLHVYRAIGNALAALQNTCYAVVECGADQSVDVKNLLAAHLKDRTTKFGIFPDLSGIVRCVAVEIRV